MTLTIGQKLPGVLMGSKKGRPVYGVSSPLSPPPPPPPPPTIPTARVIGADTTLLQAVLTSSQTVLEVVEPFPTYETSSGTFNSNTAPTGFPLGGSNFYILVNSPWRAQLCEVMQVNTGATSGASWTVARAQLGTSAATFEAGVRVYQCTYLTSSITSTATSMSISDGSFLPQLNSLCPYFLMIGNPNSTGPWEVVRVKSGAGTTTLSIARGQFSTTPTSWASNSIVALWVPIQTFYDGPSGFVILSGTYLGYRQAVLSTWDPNWNGSYSNFLWQDSSLILLGPTTDFINPWYVPLNCAEEYNIVSNDTVNSDLTTTIDFSLTQAVPAPEQTIYKGCSYFSDGSNAITTATAGTITVPWYTLIYDPDNMLQSGAGGTQFDFPYQQATSPYLFNPPGWFISGILNIKYKWNTEGITTINLSILIIGTSNYNFVSYANTGGLADNTIVSIPFLAFMTSYINTTLNFIVKVNGLGAGISVMNPVTVGFGSSIQIWPVPQYEYPQPFGNVAPPPGT